MRLRDSADVKRLEQENGPNLVPASPNGLVVGHYEREGEIKTSDTTLDSPSDREIARRERIKGEGQRGRPRSPTR